MFIALVVRSYHNSGYSRDSKLQSFYASYQNDQKLGVTDGPGSAGRYCGVSQCRDSPQYSTILSESYQLVKFLLKVKMWHWNELD